MTASPARRRFDCHIDFYSAITYTCLGSYLLTEKLKRPDGPRSGHLFQVLSGSPFSDMSDFPGRLFDIQTIASVFYGRMFVKKNFPHNPPPKNRPFRRVFPFLFSSFNASVLPFLRPAEPPALRTESGVSAKRKNSGDSLLEWGYLRNGTVFKTLFCLRRACPSARHRNILLLSAWKELYLPVCEKSSCHGEPAA